jgi:hypothetical protein
MHSSGLSSRLRTTLTEYVDAAAQLLREDVAGGAEVPFELASHRGRSGAKATLYCYEPLTRAFLVEREEELARLPEHGTAVTALGGLHGLDRYLASRGLVTGQEIIAEDMRPRTRTGARGRTKRATSDPRARTALRELLADVFEGQSEFDLHPERVAAALARLQGAELAGAADTVTIVATLHGLTIASQELALTEGLTIAVADALCDVPEAARTGDGGQGDHLLVALVLDAREEGRGNASVGRGSEAAAIDRGRDVLRELLRALRLFGDGRVTLGELAWVRVGGGDGRWRPTPLGTGGRPQGMLVVTAEQEDELRAFCDLVSRRAPHANELAWALRRFELGCERASACEGLSDHLLGLRALLEPEGPASGFLAGRVAALCATPEHRLELTERMTRALELERAVIAGTAAKRAREGALVGDVADHLRALLRDVICGHLAPDLVTLADELLLAPEKTSGEEVSGEEGEPGEVLDVVV